MMQNDGERWAFPTQHTQKRAESEQRAFKGLGEHYQLSVMNANTVVTGAVAASAVAIVVCLFSAAYMFADVNNFYDDAMKDMFEFRVSHCIFWNVLLRKESQKQRAVKFLSSTL